MQVNIHSIHFDADQKLLRFIDERLNKLGHFYDGIIGGEVFLRLEKSDSKENKVTEIKLNLPGKEIFAKKQCKSFEEAADTAVEALRRQIKRHKEKVKGV